MASGSEFGSILRLTTWGESHGAGIGAVLDGFPAGMELSEEDIQKLNDDYLVRKEQERRRKELSEEEKIAKMLNGLGKEEARIFIKNYLNGLEQHEKPAES